MLISLKKYLFYTFIVLCFGCNKKKDRIYETSKRSNELINETSPYLLQHAYNPVNWKPWSDKTLNEAKSEQKLMIISVGYAACHWCHVMEKESFENDSIAKLMNEKFINIKVDREERPDVDQVYIDAVQLMNGSAGWPLNCITLPDGKPIFGGTYFTKDQWQNILIDISNLYEENPEKVIAYAEKLTEGVNGTTLIQLNQSKINSKKEDIQKWANLLIQDFDLVYGGQKNAPKFPMPDYLNFLIKYNYYYDHKVINDFLNLTLTNMSFGGIYDQLGGGFSRYSVDEKWKTPHFEKMLYDNAQLVSLYSNAYRNSKNKEYKTIVFETLNFIEKELHHPKGGFYSSLDADSLNQEQTLEEGIFYTWTVEDLKSILKEDFNLFKLYYNIKPSLSWEKGAYILHKSKRDEVFCNENNIDITNFKKKLKHWKTILYKHRSKRNKPRLDDKILASWNALMVKGYVDAYKAFNDKEHLEKALKSANFIKNSLIDSDQILYHNFKNGKITIKGFLEDYALVTSSFLDLYEITGNRSWLQVSQSLTNQAIDKFYNQDNGMFFFTENKITSVINRKTEVIDLVIPSSNAFMAENLFRLGHYFFNEDYSTKAKQMLKNMLPEIEKNPQSYTKWFSLYLNYTQPFYEVAISGKENKAIQKELFTTYIPNILVSSSDVSSDLPLLKHKYVENETLIYVCIQGVCKLPVNSVEKALSQIKK